MGVPGMTRYAMGGVVVMNASQHGNAGGTGRPKTFKFLATEIKAGLGRMSCHAPTLRPASSAAHRRFTRHREHTHPRPTPARASCA